MLLKFSLCFFSTIDPLRLQIYCGHPSTSASFPIPPFLLIDISVKSQGLLSSRSCSWPKQPLVKARTSLLSDISVPNFHLHYSGNQAQDQFSNCENGWDHLSDHNCHHWHSRLSGVNVILPFSPIRHLQTSWTHGQTASRDQIDCQPCAPHALIMGCLWLVVAGSILLTTTSYGHHMLI